MIKNKIAQSENIKKRHIILQSILFLLILFVLLILTNNIYTSFVLPKHQQFIEEEQWQDFKESLEVNKINLSFADYNSSKVIVFMGSSHTHVGINSTQKRNVFNRGFNSNSYIEVYYKLHKALVEENVSIDILLLESDLHSLSSYMRLSENLPLGRQTWYYADFVPFNVIFNLTHKSKVHIWLENQFPSFGKAKNFFVTSFSQQEKGWLLKSGNFSSTNTSALARERVLGQFLGSNQYDPILEEYFKKIVSLADDFNVSLYLVRYPMSLEYQKEIQKNNIEVKPYYNYIKKISNHTPILNYYSLFENNSDNFYNPDHLTKEGATLLTDQIFLDLSNLHVLQ